METLVQATTDSTETLEQTLEAQMETQEVRVTQVQEEISAASASVETLTGTQDQTDCRVTSVQTADLEVSVVET